MKKRPSARGGRETSQIFLVVTALVCAITIGRFAQIMLFKQAHGQDLSKQVANLYARSSIIAAKRGTIYDVSGNPLAIDATSYSVYAVLTDEYGVPPVTADVQVQVAEALANQLGMSSDAVLDSLRAKERDPNIKQVEFGNAGRNLTVTQKKAIENLELPGIFFEETPTRLYPNGTFSSQLIGLAQMETDEQGTAYLRGMMGIEQQYDAQLAGTPGMSYYEANHSGFKIPNSEKVQQPAVQGQNIYTTIDSQLQAYLETVATEVAKEHTPESLTVTVFDPKTGDIIAATQRPTFNATDKEGIDKAWDNLLVSQAYEPGSVFKVFVLAAAVNEGVFSPLELYQSGAITVEDATIRDWNIDGWGTISYLEGFARSSNVAFVKLLSRIGVQKWRQYMEAFGFGRSTESGLANEVTGANLYDNPVTQANTSFGQGVSVTPFQMIQAFTAIANEGKMMKPNYIDRFENSDTQQVTYQQRQEVGTPVSAETARQVLAYMQEVVDSPYGTGQPYAMEQQKVGAKTGTAQIADPETGKYYSSEFLYSAMVVVPTDHPKYAIYATVRRPKNLKTGDGQVVVAKLITPLMKRLENWRVPAATTTATPNVVPDVRGQSLEQAKLTLAQHNYGTIEVLGDGDVVQDQLPHGSSEQATRTRIFLLTSGTVRMPNMRGWSSLDVLKFSQLTQQNIAVGGEGYVYEQSLAAGTELTGELSITVRLSPQLITSDRSEDAERITIPEDEELKETLTQSSSRDREEE